MEPPRFLSDIFPQDLPDLSWIPAGMDPNSSYRLAVHVGAYVKLLDDGRREYCNACNIPKILDRDSTNWNDVLGDITTEIKLGSNHKLRVTYWDKMSRSYEEITSDQKLLDAIDMYWEIRRLSLQVCVMKKDEPDSTFDIGRQQSMPCVLLGSTNASQISVEPQLEITSPTLEPPVQSSNEVAWVDDVVEYVGLDDEDPFKTLFTDSSDSEHGGLEDDVQCDGLEDDLAVNDDIKLWPPLLKRAAGRPRVRRYKAAAEGGSGKRSTRCRRCKQLGHMQKTCNEYVYDSDAPPPAPPKPKRKKGKKNIIVVPSSDITTTVSTPPPQEVDVPFATPTRDIASITTSSPMTRSMTRRLQELEPSTPTRVITSLETPSPMTRSRKRMLELEGCIEPVACAHLSPIAVVEKGKAKKLKVVRSKI